MSDLISRQAAIDACHNWDDGKDAYAYGFIVEERLQKLPSAQSEKEKAKRVLWTGWKGYRDTRYKCPNCKKPVKNVDLWLRLLAAMKPHDIELIWVKGHNGHDFNERCDKLAVASSKSDNLLTDSI